MDLNNAKKRLEEAP